MPLFYVLIAKKNNIILCDYTSHTGNFQVITMQLLQQIQPESSKSLELEEYMFHYINQAGILVLCMADKNVERKLAFTFIQDVRNTFQETYTKNDIENAKGYSLKSFGIQCLKPKMELYNDNPMIANDKADKLL
jgi:vesicle-associated membrane protein 7